MRNIQEHPVRDRIKFASEIIVTLIAGIALWNNYAANSLTRKAINVANESLKVAEHANQIASDEFIIRNRPYINIYVQDNAELAMLDSTRLKGFKLFLQNFGSIPAVHSEFILYLRRSGKWQKQNSKTSFVVMPGDRKEIMEFANSLLWSDNPRNRVDRIKLECTYFVASRAYHTTRQYSIQFAESSPRVGAVTPQEEEAD